jgi:3-oxoacyl-[acyl-carrier protein] reductase
MNILITGGASDIAFAIAKSRSQMGDAIYITSSNQASLEKTINTYRQQGLEVFGIVYDFNTAAQSIDAFNQLNDTPIHAIVFNAFTRMKRFRKFHEWSMDDFHGYADNNIRGHLEITHRFLPQMIEQQYGRLVLVSSVSAVTGTSRYGAYCMAKAALEGFFTNLAVEYSKDNILSNVLRLGLMKTSRTKLFWQKKDYQDKVNRIIPQGHMGTPEHVAHAIEPLLAKKCYMTGSIVNVSGGLPLVSSVE